MFDVRENLSFSLHPSTPQDERMASQKTKYVVCFISLRKQEKWQERRIRSRWLEMEVGQEGAAQEEEIHGTHGFHWVLWVPWIHWGPWIHGIHELINGFHVVDLWVPWNPCVPWVHETHGFHGFRRIHGFHGVMDSRTMEIWILLGPWIPWLRGFHGSWNPWTPWIH